MDLAMKGSSALSSMIALRSLSTTVEKNYKR